MSFADQAKCHLSEDTWLEQERANCDARFGYDSENRRFCHETVKREIERRREFCDH
jgi:hypothetical protein